MRVMHGKTTLKVQRNMMRSKAKTWDTVNTRLKLAKYQAVAGVIRRTKRMVLRMERSKGDKFCANLVWFYAKLPPPQEWRDERYRGVRVDVVCPGGRYPWDGIT